MGITKNIGRDAIEVIKQEAERIRIEYAYMDEMPLEGWLWEFIRRSPEYISIINELKNIAPKYEPDIEEYPNTDEVDPKVFELMDKVANMGVSFSFSDPYRRDKIKDRYLLIPLRKDLSMIRAGLFADICYAIPNCNTKYFEILEDIDTVSHFFNISSVKLSLFNSLEPLIKPPVEDFDPISAEKMLSVLSPTNPSDTLYLGISKIAKKETIMKQISKYLDEHLEPPKTRVRTDKWKYYLIAYDLKKQKGFDYPQIADVLSEAYPGGLDIEEAIKERKTKIGKNIAIGDYFTEKNCENFYKEALELIDGGYKKHLL